MKKRLDERESLFARYCVTRIMNEDILRGIEWIQKGHETLKQENERHEETIRQLKDETSRLNALVQQLQSQNKALTFKYTQVLKTTKQLIQFRNVDSLLKLM